MVQLSFCAQQEDVFSCSQGVEWYRHRAVLNKKMLLPKEVLNYLEPMEEVATDFVSRLHNVRCSDGRIKNIEMEIFMWALECEYSCNETLHFNS